MIKRKDIIISGLLQVLFFLLLGAFCSRDEHVRRKSFIHRLIPDAISGQGQRCCLTTMPTGVLQSRLHGRVPYNDNATATLIQRLSLDLFNSREVLSVPDLLDLGD
jgi:hypothetical protein